MKSSIEQLHSLGQSLWYDNIRRGLLKNGELAGMIERGDIRGVTSNPAIFNQAISKSNDYDSGLIKLSEQGCSAEEIFWQLAVEDIRAVADLFKPLYAQSRGGDGYISLEVNPNLAHSTEATIEEAMHLWKIVERPNLMVKIPATIEGIPAIQQAIFQGLNINVTLIFSLERYANVMEAYITGLEQRANAGLSIAGISSVASFFISRVDTRIDTQLQKMIDTGDPRANEATGLLGKAAIANAKLAYLLFQDTFGSERFKRLAALGARVQRPLWASTGTKNPAYRDVFYIEELIGPDTVNTTPPTTLEAFRDHGKVSLTISNGINQARRDLERLEGLGISMDKITSELENEGVQAFIEAFTVLLHSIEMRQK